jgi:hypothetical protein
MPISVLVLFFGLCGLIAVFARVRAGRQALLVLIAFLTVATIWNWIDFALMATEFGASFPISYWMPAFSSLWLATYWLALGRSNCAPLGTIGTGSENFLQRE